VRARLSLALGALLLGLGCPSQPAFDPLSPARGPGGLVGEGPPITSGDFSGGADLLPLPRTVATPPDGSAPPNCDAACEQWCDGQALSNPLNQGLCRSLWGVGLASAPVDPVAACRRLYVDMAGRLPTPDEVRDNCESAGANWGRLVQALMADPAFLKVNRRLAADRFRYSTEVVSVERIYDLDRLVTKLYEGRVPYDLFAAVAASHPVITRRYATASDTAAAVFERFLGRPPFDNERADFARLYALWVDGYFDHPELGVRLPDAHIGFPCVDLETGEIDEQRRGQCASVLWGYNELILLPDFRALPDDRGALTTWSGLLTADEWSQLTLPGRLLAREISFWERAVEDVVVQYLGYDLGAKLPEVRDRLVRWLLQHDGDIRSVHYAVATSAAYLQSAEGAPSASYRWTYGPLQQMDAEVWIDSLAAATGTSLGGCDHRISNPELLLEAGSIAAYRLVEGSGWAFDTEGALDTGYAELARTLGGCPENVVGGRYRIVSILTTATQLGNIARLCNPSLEPGLEGAAAAERLLPAGVSPDKVVSADLAEQVGEFQYLSFFGRRPNEVERAELRGAGDQCALTLCSAEELARPLCFALLSSAERIFY